MPQTCTCKEKCEAGAVNESCPVCLNNRNSCIGTEKETKPETEAEPEKPKNDKGTKSLLLLFLLTLLAGGGAFYYFKYIKPKDTAKYDPHDMRTIYVFQGKKRIEAYAQELLTFAGERGVEQKALKEHFARQKRQLKNDRRILEEANVPFTELNDQYVGFDETVGGIDLMAGKKRKPAKIVSMPEDNTYRNGFRGKKKEEPAEGNAYINEKAEEALRALRAL